MTWGPYWMLYQCPACGKKFRHTFDDTPDDRFGICPTCDAKAELKAESRDNPKDADTYEIVYIDL